MNQTNFTGTGQFKFALVNTAGTLSYWSNDGTSSAGGEPVNAVSLSVVKGLFSVQLGDTNLTHMLIVPPSVFTNNNLRFRLWFNDGISGFRLLSPDQPIGAVGYAMMSAQVSDGAITSNKLAAGSVTVRTLTLEVDTRYVHTSGDSMTGTLNLPTNGLVVGAGQLVVSGGNVVIGTNNPTNPLQAGQLEIGTNNPISRLQVVGDDAAGVYVFTVYAGTNRIAWGRKK